MKIINKKPLSEIQEEKEMKKIEIQADIFEVVASLYEDMEDLKTRVKQLEGGVK